jgi:hypothetical protein
MQEILEVLSVLFRPEVLLPVGIIAVTTIFRTILGFWKPDYEKSPFYKTLLHVLQPIVGIAMAFAVKGVGMFQDMKWGYMVLVGIVAGFSSTWFWILFKAMAKKYLKLTDTDIGVRVSKTLIPSEPESKKKDEPDDDGDDHS